MLDADNVEELLGDLAQAPPPSHAPTMGTLQKVSYTHTDMIDYIIAHPGCNNNQLAIRYGYSPSWISSVMASDAWKAAMAARREELVDPVLLMSLNERFEGMTRRSLERLQEKLDAPNVSDQVVLKAVELGAKAMGIGGNAAAAPQAPAGDHLAQLAERMLALQSKVRQGALQYVETVEARTVTVS